MKYQLLTEYADNPGYKMPIHRPLGHSALLAEFAERLDDHELYGNVVSWTILPVGGEPINEVATLTVEDRKGIHTTVHADEQAALDCLRGNYDPEHEYPDDDFVQSLIDQQGLVIYIDTHIIEGASK